MIVEEGYYYFFSTKDQELEKFRSFQNMPKEYLIPYGDICYYQFRKSQNFYRVNNLFNKKNIKKVNSQTYKQIQQYIKCYAENIYKNIQIIPDMRLENTFIQLQKIKIQKGYTQLILSSEETAINVIFLQQSKLKYFQNEVICFEQNYSKYAIHFSWALPGLKQIKNELCKKIDEHFFKDNQSNLQDDRKIVATYLFRNLEDYLKNLQDEWQIYEVHKILNIIKYQQFKYMNQDFIFDLISINDVKSLIQSNKSQQYDKLYQLQSYCLIVESSKQYPGLFQEIKSYLMQVQTYLNLNDCLINIDITALNIMGGILIPYQRSQLNILSQDFKQMVKSKEYDIKDYIFSILKKKINDL